jgi:Stage II sporulation protein E (SpoIIE)
MALIPLPIEKAVGRTWAALVYETLAREMFANLRFAMAGLIAALILYYAMLVVDSRAAKYLPWMILQGIWNAIILIYHFRAERAIRDTRLRVGLSVTTACLNGILLGMGFLAQFSQVANPKMQTAVVALVVGVAGASAFTLACHRFIFVLFTYPWLVPISIYLVFFTGELGYIILGSMSVPYLGLLTVLCWKDYERRVELIRAELQLRDERNEIAANLQLVQDLKEQQDHDYYLTHQLIKPLAVNAAQNDPRIQVVFYTKQKKEFEFRNERLSIGGDLSLAYTLPFPGRTITVVVNADAMGKSIQGAGGCLVFGSVFRAIIDRAKTQELTDPALWLKQTVIELQKIFETFDCSMLVSAYFFLIDNATGEYYSISAEHPRAVLYRGARAKFLGGEHRLLKLGMPEFTEDFEVNTGRLNAGDILIIGSDGRDDLVQRTAQTGGIRINTDAGKILHAIERGRGELGAIAQYIAASGEVSDDLSLVRIAYRPQASPTALRPAVALREARDFTAAGDLVAAGSILATLSESSTGRSASIGGLKLALQIHQFSLAGIFAKRLNELGATDAQSLYWSAHAHFYLGQPDQAMAELRRALPADPAPRIRRLPNPHAAA